MVADDECRSVHVMRARVRIFCVPALSFKVSLKQVCEASILLCSLSAFRVEKERKEDFKHFDLLGLNALKTAFPMFALLNGFLELFLPVEVAHQTRDKFRF